MPHAYERIRRAVLKDPSEKLTALYHHVYNVEHLRAAYQSLRRNAAPGVDRVTWRQYGEALEENLSDLADRLRRKAYRAKPVRRTYISKTDGRPRPLGVTALEDKIVQKVATEVLNAIFEPAFLGFSYGFRPKRSQHNALDALWVGLTQKKVNWVLDADVSGFFDCLNHSWLMRLVEHRISDRYFLRLLRKWLNAGVLEDGKWTRQTEGSPQGAVVSPVLANVYLHYVFDLWAHAWLRRAKGEVILIRYADDLVVGFQYREDAERFRRDLAERFAKFDLELHPEKTRLVEFGRFAARDRQARGEGRPDTFDFLGFTHVCGTTRKRKKFVVVRRTKRKRWQAKLRELKQELRKRMHDPVPKVGAWLRSVLTGHYRYYGVPLNGSALSLFRFKLMRLWRQVLRRRSQRNRITWARMYRLSDRWLPFAKIYHPWPDARLRVTT
jgi:group II intron reverse transcriptase/maturase